MRTYQELSLDERITIQVEHGSQRQHQWPAAPIPAEGCHLAKYTQDELDAIALSLNNRPRKRPDARTPLECYTDLIQPGQMPIRIMQ